MQCQEIYIIEKMKTEFSMEFNIIKKEFEDSEKNYRHKFNEELYMILKNEIPNFNPEKYSMLDFVAWGEKRLKLRKSLEDLKNKVRLGMKK